MNDLVQWMTSVVVRTEVAFECALPAKIVSPQCLHAAVWYATLGAGKCVYPLLIHAADTLGDASLGTLDGVSCAMEMTHAYSPAHDDMFCIGDDGLRRGRPATHRAYNEAMALLVGDVLQTQAFTVLAEQGVVRPVTRAVLMGGLARVLDLQGMAGGQTIDLQSVGITLSRDEPETMHRMKTGALLRANLRMDTLCTEVSTAALEYVSAYTGAVGLAFQVVDDILDVTADTATPGKIADKDKANDKPAHVSILGLDKTRVLADESRAVTEAAVVELVHEIGCETGRARTIRLAEIADLTVRRGH